MEQTEQTMDISKNVARLLDVTGKELAIHGYKTYFVDSDSLNLEHTKAGGYLEDVSRSLVVAVRRPEKIWVPIYTHEYGHFLQVFFYPEIANKARGSNTVLHHHKIRRKEYSNRHITMHIKRILTCEVDAERTGVGLLRSFKVFKTKRGIIHNIKKSNAYFLSIPMRAFLHCNFNKMPAKTPEVWKELPDTLDIDHLEEWDKYIELFRKYCNPVEY